MPSPRPSRSGWVPEDARHTVRVVVRCAPDLAERARALLSDNLTLADLLRLGVETLERRR